MIANITVEGVSRTVWFILQPSESHGTPQWILGLPWLFDSVATVDTMNNLTTIGDPDGDKHILLGSGDGLHFE